MKYFFKLKTNEKLEVSKDEFDNYVYKQQDLIIVKTKLAHLYIKESNILFAYTLSN